jgi:alpha-glucoside transport system permease protein
MTATVTEEAVPAPPKPVKRKRSSSWTAWLWVTPALLFLLLFLIWPTIRTIWISFYSGSVINPTREFIGVDNYVELFTNDPSFIHWGLPPWSALFNSLVWVIFFTTGVIAFGLLVGVLADKVKYEKTAKAIVFLPLVVSFTAASVVFRLVYAVDPNIGVLNALLKLVGLGPVAWLGEEDIVNFAIIAAGIWVWTSLSMTILAAAYKALPVETHEAAAVDGANEWQVFWKVSLPQMRGPIIVVAVTMIINALKAVDLVLVMTEGGPGYASRIVGFTVYWETFTNGYAGYGSAVAVILLIIMAPLMWWQMQQIRASEAR